VTAATPPRPRSSRSRRRPGRGPRAWAATGLLASLALAGCTAAPSPDAVAGHGVVAVEPLALQAFDFGGDFELTAHTGKTFKLADHRGQVVLLFFGYTFCPDICPTTLGTMVKVEGLLGPDRERLQTVFVSVDPDRDTPDRLREYLEHFEARAVGVTGPKAQLDVVVAQYAAFYEKQPSDSVMGYTVDHTSRLYLIDRHGKVRYLFRYGEEAETIAKGVRLALAE
jgi:protein SCO1/2